MNKRVQLTADLPPRLVQSGGDYCPFIADIGPMTQQGKPVSQNQPGEKYQQRKHYR